jgi:hypothetical protein
MNANHRHAITRLLELAEVVHGTGLQSSNEFPKLRFGEVAVVLGFCTPRQVRRALVRQRADRQSGRPHRLIGEILLAQGAIEEEEKDQVVDVLIEMAREQRQRPTEKGMLEWEALVSNLGAA